MYAKIIYRAMQILFDNNAGSYTSKMKAMVKLLKRITNTEGMDMIIHTLVSIVLALLIIKVFVIYMDLKSLDMVSVDAFIQKTYTYMILAAIVIMTPTIISTALDFNYLFFDYIASNTENITDEIQEESKIYYAFKKDEINNTLDGCEDEFKDYYTGSVLGIKIDALPSNNAFWLGFCSVIIILIDIICSVLCLVFVFVPLVELVVRLTLFPISVLTGTSYFISIKKILSVGIQMSVMVLILAISSSITIAIINNLVDINNGSEQIDYCNSRIDEINSRYDELVEEGIEWTEDLSEEDKEIFGLLLKSDYGNEKLEDKKDEIIKFYNKQIKYIRTHMVITKEDKNTKNKKTVSYLSTGKVITFDTINEIFTFKNFLFIILAKLVVLTCITKAKSYTKEIFIQG